MKNKFLILLFFVSSFCFGQIKIKGTVKTTNKPLEGVAVYFNNTVIGTTTDENGEFSILVNEGEYELIISYLGFKKIIYSLNTKNYKKLLFFSLEEEENVLDEVIIKNTLFDDEWNYNFYTFRKEFIGISKFAEDCKIINPKVLFFETDATKRTLRAFAKKPIEIINTSLGYSITYELVSFTFNNNMVSYLGYSRYKELKSTKKSTLRKWKRNREKAYKGSISHFYKSLLNNRLKKEGFKVSQFKRTINEKRPTELAIKQARELIINSKIKIDFSKEIKVPRTAIDSAILIIKKRRLPKYKDYYYNNNLKENEIISIKNDTVSFSFLDNLSITYKKEREEKNFFKKNRPLYERNLHPQTSYLFPIEKPITFNSFGVLKNPLSVYYEGYWSYEKFANALPLDYEPVGSSQ